MLAKVQSLAAVGLDCLLIEVELDIHRGLPRFTVVGLPDSAVQESRERVRSAVKNSDFRFPPAPVVASLAPADVRKSGPSFDFPIALGVIMASEQLLPTRDISDTVFVGELALNGDLRHVSGILPMALAAESLGIKKMFVPAESAKEASLAEGVEIYPIRNLREAAEFLMGQRVINRQEPLDFSEYAKETVMAVDFSSVRGQEHAKRALEIAAAGGHNVLLNGSPGAGKTLMAKAFRSILPTMEKSEAMEVAQVYSIAGLLPKDMPLPKSRPFRIVHHTASAVSIVGGGAKIRPGEISLAHRGVLFLDELPEFPSQVLEVLRQPLEDREVTISRAQGSLRFPSDFTLIAAMNPCSCGYYNVPDAEKECSCSAQQISKYQKRISGPLLDRIDLYVDISPVKFEKLSGEEKGESSAIISARVEAAKERQKKRFSTKKIRRNSEMVVDDIEKTCVISEEAKALLGQAMKQYSLSARAYHRILKVARTIADLAGESDIDLTHVAEALQYRSKFSEQSL